MHETWERKQMLTNLKMGQTHDNLVSDKWSNFSTILTNCVPFDLCPYWFAEHKRSFSRQMDNFPWRGEFSFYMPDVMRTNKLGKTAAYLRWNIDGQAHENANVYIHLFFFKCVNFEHSNRRCDRSIYHRYSNHRMQMQCNWIFFFLH